VYGGQPEFSDVFDDADPQRWRPTVDFYRRFLALTNVSYDRTRRAYVYAAAPP
jgi:hypothetical protein